MLPLPENITVVTDMADLLWSVISRDRFGDRTVLGMIHRFGSGFQATVLADPVRTVIATTLSEAAALVADAGPGRGAGGGGGRTPPPPPPAGAAARSE
jgi:hypothetical protein